MAQTRKKRQTKHRGNAAGKVEVRGRTGRKLEPGERKLDGRGTARKARADRFSRPPTWRGAANRALFATIVFVAIVIFAFGQKPAAAIALGGFMLLLYIPLGYYTDMLFFRRRQAKQLEQRGK
jgi:hypothetical protein